MTVAVKNYKQLWDVARQTKLLESTQALLEWDQETQMPSGSSAIRAEQISQLAGIIHKEKTGKKFVNALSKLIDLKTGKFTDSQGLNDEQKRAVKKWYSNYLKDTVLPAAFVERFAKLTSEATVIWRDAKNQNTFKTFAPYLEKIVQFCREKADLIGYKEHPYDALLDDYEEGMTSKEIKQLFDPLKHSVTTLLKNIGRSKQVDDRFLYGQIPAAEQLAFGKILLKDMGYDLNHGRLDISAHPFSTSFHPTDSRITTRIHPESIISNIFVILHEAGHALYEMGLPSEHFGSPLGAACSMGMHESQSRWWETRIGQSRYFWQHYLPLLTNAYKGGLEKVSLEEFYRGINKVEPSFIRVEADEVTYSLHVILRFELELALFEGSLKVKDLPDAWNQKMKEYLGITPKTNQEGCLQDVHWSFGGFGYFPTYTLGNLIAAQLFEKFEKEIPDWGKKVAQGELLFIKSWLNKAVHQHGQRYISKQLVEEVTGKPFSSSYYTDYLNRKYQEIYQY